MARKAMIVADPGIDGAFAVTLALYAPEIDLLGLAATAGNVAADQATRNVHIVVEQLDPPRWPRLGAALPVDYDVHALALHGPGGLGGVEFPSVPLHHTHAADKLISDLVHLYPKELTVVLLGPATAFARALDRDPEAAALVGRVVVVGGVWREAGDVTAASEFHFYCDAPAARQVLRCGAPLTLLPLDVTRKVVFSPTDLLQLPAPESKASRFLGQVAPHAIGATSSQYGVEGCFLQDVFGVMMLAQPEAFKTKQLHVDVETRGELTRGMTVVDARWACTAKPNVEMAVDVDVAAVRRFIHQTLERAALPPEPEA